MKEEDIKSVDINMHTINQHHLKKEPATSQEEKNEIDYSFVTQCLSILKKNIEEITITNEKQSSSNKYLLQINRRAINLVYKENQERIEYKFNIQNRQLIKNKMIAPDIELNNFVKKISEIGKDLSDNKASMYEVNRKHH